MQDPHQAVQPPFPSPQYGPPPAHVTPHVPPYGYYPHPMTYVQGPPTSHGLAVGVVALGTLLMVIAGGESFVDLLWWGLAGDTFLGGIGDMLESDLGWGLLNLARMFLLPLALAAVIPLWRGALAGLLIATLAAAIPVGMGLVQIFIHLVGVGSYLPPQSEPGIGVVSFLSQLLYLLLPVATFGGWAILLWLPGTRAALRSA